jgi:hypothetical protein
VSPRRGARSTRGDRRGDRLHPRATERNKAQPGSARTTVMSTRKSIARLGSAGAGNQGGQNDGEDGGGRRIGLLEPDVKGGEDTPLQGGQKHPRPPCLSSPARPPRRRQPQRVVAEEAHLRCCRVRYRAGSVFRWNCVVFSRIAISHVI